jgi:hypothetical protein
MTAAMVEPSVFSFSYVEIGRRSPQADVAACNNYEYIYDLSGTCPPRFTLAYEYHIYTARARSLFSINYITEITHHSPQ